MKSSTESTDSLAPGSAKPVAGPGGSSGSGGHVSGTHVGFWGGLMTALLAVLVLAAAFTAPPRSGAYYPGDCIQYP
ncbi:hypothetical protein NHF46_07995 [Arthrobacter alpinus]|uniref:hypothetical protein n=1 Tax=Arthrobacter alpinus TaxID=656366 RepID=UPI000AF083F7|nr:hypothetical protein [Arthrobacter alpinus]MDD0857696.1 hypothetical protein [Arthrobacter alpinus]